ncbi:MAG: cyclic nucleotide-binding domain-containing protein [Vicinamibacteria bacterium]
MPISFGGKPKEEDVVSLIAQKKYSRAVEVLKAQLQRRGANPSLRMQLADVLILADKKKEAIALLLPLADQYANEGFAAKAVSVLKKVQKVDPGRKDVDARLARLIEEKQREAVVLPTRSPIGVEPMPEMGMEAADGPALEIGFSIAPISAPAPVEPEAAPPAPQPVVAPVARPRRSRRPRRRRRRPRRPRRRSSRRLPPPLAPALPTPVAPPPPPAAGVAPVAAVPAGPAGDIEDYDLLYVGDDEDEADVLPLEAEIVEDGAAPAADPMSAGQFADELMGLVDSVFQEFPQAAPAPVAAAAPAEDDSAQGRQIVVSPLFQDFSVDEMVAVIQGLKLLAFDRGEAILKEGQPGGSLYMLTSGRVRAFRKNATTGKQDILGDLKEGAFFGEVSILTGQPRMASIVALTRCELLELDRPTLDGITATHPHVWDVLREFAKKRAG